MNVLPLVILLILILSALSIQQIENFKNREIRQKEFEEFISNQADEDLNQRNKEKFDSDFYAHTRRINLGYLANNSEGNNKQYTQLKNVLKEFIKDQYGKTEFYQKAERRNPQILDLFMEQFLENLRERKEIIKGGIENIAQLRFKDPEMQDFYYHLLKGSVKNRQQLSHYKESGFDNGEKSYPSLFLYLAPHGNNGLKGPKIPLYSSPRELLRAIYVDEESVNQVMQRRIEFKSDKKENKAKQTQAFQNAVKDLPKKPGIENDILDFSVTTSDPNGYN